MIIRVFRARIHPGKEDEFEGFVRKARPHGGGASGVLTLRLRRNRSSEFVVVTHWDSVGALQAFAGPRWQEAVVEPDEDHMVAEVFCDHYESRGGLTHGHYHWTPVASRT